MEIWDAYDENFNKVDGVTLIRDEEIPDGYYHLVSEIIVRHTDGTYLMMQRDFRKHLGGKWELTAGGSALQGADSLECAIRELKEETGVVTNKLTRIGRVQHCGYKTFYEVYMCITNIQKDEIILQEGETSSYKWVSLDELSKMPIEEFASIRFHQFIM
ncbi:MAG: NUDIX domain-containing protein [Butyrivibrio sp.]|nr:NUDIX domain-containing protein [Butyrivibrio sp.]